MNSFSPGVALLGGLLLLILIMTRGGRLLLGTTLVIALLIAARGVFVRTHTCSTGGTEACVLELQPTWSGFCSTERAAILTVDGSYFLTAEQGREASATCVDLRFWSGQ